MRRGFFIKKPENRGFFIFNFFDFFIFCVKKFTSKAQKTDSFPIRIAESGTPFAPGPKKCKCIFWVVSWRRGGTGETGGVVVNYYIYTYHKNFAQFE